jgi:hypothetical protein
MAKLIDLYKEWMETGELDYAGLCSSIPFKYEDALEMVSPSRKEMTILRKEGKPYVFWGCGIKYSRIPKDKTAGCFFSPLRQNIVLLICAIHNEI